MNIVLVIMLCINVCRMRMRFVVYSRRVQQGQRLERAMQPPVLILLQIITITITNLQVIIPLALNSTQMEDVMISLRAPVIKCHRTHARLPCLSADHHLIIITIISIIDQEIIMQDGRPISPLMTPLTSIQVHFPIVEAISRILHLRYYITSFTHTHMHMQVRVFL